MVEFFSNETWRHCFCEGSLGVAGLISVVALYSTALP